MVSWRSTLPSVQGRLRENVPLAPYTWFQVGGKADILFRPAHLEDLQHFLKNLDPQVPVYVLGAGSNLLVRDGGIEGVIIRLGAPFTHVSFTSSEVTAGAGCLDRTLAQQAQTHGAGGLEFFIGIPGTIGGALRMNAGAFGGEVKDIFISAKAVDRQGNLISLNPSDMGFSYRKTQASKDLIFIEGTFSWTPKDPLLIQNRLAEIIAERDLAQPTRVRTGGSTFANPAGQKAWELIDSVGGRGLRQGGAQVSEKHCNFLINTGDATATDLENLGDMLRSRVQLERKVDLQWEIVRWGKKV